MRMNKIRRPKVIAYRNRYDIMMKILEHVDIGVDKGKLMKTAEIAPELFEAYLKLLMEKKLLKVAEVKESLGEIFKVTDKGMDFMFHYRIMQDLTK